MNGLCWNCRGMGNPRSVRALRRLFLSETMVNKNVVEKLKDKFGFDSAIGVNSSGLSGGLCLYWNSVNVSFSLISLCKNHICGDLVMSGRISWCFVGIYGWPDAAGKCKTWKLIRELSENYDSSLLFGGDFNEILSYEEKEGVRIRREEPFLNFGRLYTLATFVILVFMACGIPGNAV